MAVIGTLGGAAFGFAGSQLTEWRRVRSEDSLQATLRRQALQDRRTNFELELLAEIGALLEEVSRAHVSVIEARHRKQGRNDAEAGALDVYVRLMLRTAHLDRGSDLQTALDQVQEALAHIAGGLADEDVRAASSALTRSLRRCGPVLAARRAELLRQQEARVDNPLTSTKEAGPEGPAVGP